MGSNYDTPEILQQLDQCAREFNFPMLDNGHVYPVDARMTAYGDTTEWAIFIETLGFHARAGRFDGIYTALHCFGNDLSQPPGLSNDRFLHVVSDGPSGPLFDEQDWERIRADARDITIRDTVVSISADPAYYKAKGIQLLEPPHIHVFELLRGLVPEHRELLLATKAELGAQLPGDPPKLIQLDEWNHPDLAGEDVPSQNETFQQIALVLVHQDPSQYNPSNPSNTHWSNWPEGGAL